MNINLQAANFNLKQNLQISILEISISIALFSTAGNCRVLQTKRVNNITVNCDFESALSTLDTVVNLLSAFHCKAKAMSC